jgi:magnesium chelatase accessory protein
MNRPSSLPMPPDWPNREFSRVVRAGGIEWHVQVAGSGPTLLLLHGTGSSVHTWADLLVPLAGMGTVVAPDLPGHGFTRSATPWRLSLPEVATSLEALLAALDVPPVAIGIGHSAGAALAIQWALHARRKPAAIVGFNPSLVPPPDLYDNFLAPFITPIATSPFVTTGLAALASRSWLVGGLLDSTRSRLSAAQRERYLALFARAEHVQGTMEFMAATNLKALLAAAHDFAIPTTFVLGRLDHWVPDRPVRRVLARDFPRARVLNWQGGHLLHEEHPGRAVRLVAEVLERLDAPATRAPT